MLDLLKELLGIENNAKDATLKLYIDLAEKGIIKYINKATWTQEDTIKYTNQIVLYAKFLCDNKNNMNVISKSQGARSVTYKEKTNIPDYIVDSLPHYIRVVG
jgi:hypothetical protein